MNEWVFLRGLARHQGHWLDFPKSFQEHFPEDRIHFLDFPGAGTVQQESCPWGLTDVIAHLRGQLKETLGSGKQVTLFGVSLGGMMAVEWLRQFPHEVKGVVAINASVRSLYCPPWWRLRPGAWSLLIRAVICLKRQAREELVAQLVSESSPVRSKLSREWAKLPQDLDVDRITFLKQLGWALQFSLTPSPVKNKGLLLVGGRDQLVASRCSQLMSEQWSWPIKIHATAGHEITQDAPLWVIEQVSSWIKDLDLRS